MHPVVLDAQIGNAGASPFARFQLEQEGVTVVLDRAQFIEFAVKACGDHTAVTYQHRRQFGNRAAQQLFDMRRGAQACSQAVQQAAAFGQGLLQCWQGLQGSAKSGQFAWADLTQGDARGDSFDIGNASQSFAQQLMERFRAALQQGSQRFVTRHSLIAITLGM